MSGDKSIIRKTLRELSLRIPPEQKLAQAGRVFGYLEESGFFRKARTIGIYNALPDELPSEDFILKWQKIKRFAMPVVNGETMYFTEFGGFGSMIEGAFGIPEFPSGKPVHPDEIDLVVVPGVAFDKYGNRLGRGKGFYDRFLCGASVHKIGICMAHQLLDKLPTNPHDVPMDSVITPEGPVIKQYR